MSELTIKSLASGADIIEEKNTNFNKKMMEQTQISGYGREIINIEVYVSLNKINLIFVD